MSGKNLLINFLNQDCSARERLDLDKVTNMPCLICNKKYTLKQQLDEYLGHLFTDHRLVIADVPDISLIEEYLAHWQVKLNEDSLPLYCTTMLLNQKPDGTFSKDEKYFLLSDVIEEDMTLRKELDSRLLEIVLDQHQYELTDRSFNRDCIFCRDVIGPLRRDFVAHLYNKHFLYLGRARKLVFMDHLFARIEQQMEDLICLYCEKLFKDRTALKEHMRKKGHKRINPANKSYDQYFLINYFKEQERNKATNIERDPLIDEAALDSDSEWAEWQESQAETVTCLFCNSKQKNYSDLKAHLIEIHQFYLSKELKDRCFYERIKIINFIRRQMLNYRCISCEKKHEDLSTLQQHLMEDRHFVIPAKERWNQPEYFFPTFEDDALLYFIEEAEADDEDAADGSGTSNNDSNVQIFSEDSIVLQINKDAENLSRESFQLNE